MTFNIIPQASRLFEPMYLKGRDFNEPFLNKEWQEKLGKRHCSPAFLLHMNINDDALYSASIKYIFSV